MARRYVCMALAGASCLLSACGNAPAPPTAVQGTGGGGSAASTGGAVLGNRPGTGGGGRATDEPTSSGGAADPGDGGVDARAAEPAPRERVYFACTESVRFGCDYIHVTMREPEVDLCVQMTLDTCEVYGAGDLQVDVPLAWRLASASILVAAEECEPGAFYADSTSVIDASGSIDWNVETAEPTEMVIDVSLESSGVGSASVPPVVTVSTTSLAGPLGECED